jgi:carbon storage regulator
MLILSRKLRESIVIDGRITVKVLLIDKDTVKLGVQAPTELPVDRKEIHIKRNKQASMNAGYAIIPKSQIAYPTPPLQIRTTDE